ncbi:TonB-dependent receptor [Allosphingosinicella flava]|uniref:TonB-dependent receptor n=1 Tax=Allosphingosinicella flava TaxID=2771430 RepID=A0A7T2GJ53_9SPHN|nr:TonB-dependent receptor [Sphingosinicella flava]QPQ54839.1 TonB-dependent receptor [Sphingosinicella flava]
MKIVYVSTAAIAAFLAAAPAFADDGEIIVTATRSGDGIERNTYGGSVTVIDAEALQDRQVRQISDVLRDVPGVSVSRSGAVGGLTQIRLRGGEANHTLILIDGIEAADPYRGGELDFATLIADEAARIEILRGQQSALYGSDAIGGVVHYITASGAEAPGVRGRLEGGTFGSVGGAARAGGVAGGLDYVVQGAFDVTDGTPSARNGTRDLDAASTALSTKLAYTATPDLRLKAVLRYARTDAEVNREDGDFASPTYGLIIDTDDEYTNRAWYGLVGGEFDMLDGRWTHGLTAQFNDTRREDRDGDGPTFSTKGGRIKGSYDSRFRFGSGDVRHVLTAAVDLERESFQNVPVSGPAGPGNLNRQIGNIGLVGLYDLSDGDRIGFGASLRHDDNDHFSDATTWRLRGSVRAAEGLYLRAAAGTGIKNPTLYELFASNFGTFIGNPDLKPEKSEGWEIGADFVLRSGAIRLGATYFDATLKDEIYVLYSATFEATPDNRDTKSTQKSVELFANARLSPAWRVDLAYTYTDAKENGAREIRRPKHIASANVRWQGLDDRMGITATARYNGAADESDFRTFPATLVKLDDYVLVNLAADYRVSDRWSLFGRIENVFDADYEDVFSYRTPGRAAYLGVRAGF